MWDYSAPVAQLDRVPGYEPGGREFDKFAGSEFRMRLRLRSEPEGALRVGVHANMQSRSDYKALGQDARNNLSGCV